MKKYLCIGTLLIIIWSCSAPKKDRGSFKTKITHYKSSQIRLDDDTNDYTILVSGDTIRNVNDSGSTKFFKFDKIDSAIYLIKIIYIGGKDEKMGGNVVLKDENTFILSPIGIKKAPTNCCLDISLVIFEIRTNIPNPVFKNSFFYK